jgi:S-layer protein
MKIQGEIMTKSQIKFVVESYAKYFGRAADADKIDYYGLKENGKAEKASEILKNIIADADAEKAELSTSDFVNNAFQNLFGRNATTKEMNKYSKVIDAGKNLPINSIVKSAAKVDKDVYNNKLEVAAKYAELGGKGDLDLSKISKGNLIKDIKTVTTLADLQAKYVALADNSGIPSSFDGKTFFLTTGVDAGKDFIGTNKGDLFTADNSTGVSKISAADTLDGGKGVDTFKIYDDTTAAVAATTVTAGSLPTLKNIENVALYNLYVGDLDLKKWDTVETLYVVNAAATAGGAAKGFEVGKKVTTVNFEDIAVNQTLTFDKDLTAATVG